MPKMTLKDFENAVKLVELMSKISVDWFQPPVINTPTQAELAKIIEASEFSDDLFGKGILFGVRAHSLKITGTGEIVILGELTVEGVGRTPKQALLNTLAGGHGEDIEDISQALRNAQGHPRTMWLTAKPKPKQDRGFFLRFNHVKGKWEQPKAGLKLDPLRRKAKLEFEAFSNIARQGRRRGIQAIIDSQRAYQNLYVNFQDTIRASGLEAQVREVMLLREQAAEQLRKAREAYAVAAKYQKVAAGLKMVSSLLSTGALAGERIMSWRNSQQSQSYMAELQEDLDRWTFDIGTLKSEIEQLGPQIREQSQELDGLLRDAIPQAPLPNVPGANENYIPQGDDDGLA